MKVNSVSSLKDNGYDSIVLVASGLDDLKGNSQLADFLLPHLKEQVEIDKAVLKIGTCIRVELPAKRLIYATTGPLNRDIDDVRRFYDAAIDGIQRALSAGSRKPMLVTVASKLYQHSSLVSLLGALHALYVPLEVREDVPLRAKKVDKFGFLGDQNVIDLAVSLESGRAVARDIGGSDPERMAAPKVEEYVRNIFKGTNVSVDVISDDEQLCKEYPLFSAVNRCAKGVERHRGRIIYLAYSGEGPIKKTLMIVSKGVTYDTGGADIKAGGIMAGMHRDKCGAAAAAGFMKVLAELKPSNIKVIAALSMVRNSVGSDCYVADEIVTARSGVRVRVNNTDAEGRMAMADVLCRMKELAFNEVDPSLMTIATLTGHAVLAYGDNYSAIMDNGPACQDGTAKKIQVSGEEIADPLEVSTIRREDYLLHKGKNEYEDVVQSNTLPSSRTARGHQAPAAFLIMASGLDKHGNDSVQPLKYSHIDIAGGAGIYPGIPTGSPVLALAKTFLPSFF